MPDQSLLEDLDDDREFNVEFVGNFGRFVSFGSYPVDYFLTSLSMKQAYSYLHFARDIQMEDINFDLLMQRDIDEARVENEIMPYLKQDSGATSTRPLFFPPLLAAVVPVEGGRINSLYGSKSIQEVKPGFSGVSWEKHFQVYGKVTDKSDGLNLAPEIPGAPKIKAKQAVLALRTADVNDGGVMLVVIDGQHRLRALKRLMDENSQNIKDLILPVCIMYPPNSHSGVQDPDTTPSIPRVFRNLFVDVNSTMKEVGGHFNILLSDKNVGDIACRVFCDEVLKSYGKEGLALIEWNTRGKKDAYNVTKKYTSSSIGILKRGLEDNFKKDSYVYRLLKITAGSQDLFPEGADDDEYYPKIKWDKFSYAQSNSVKKRVNDHLVPFLLRLYFESVPFEKMKKVFLDEIKALKNQSQKGGHEGLNAQAVLSTILEYKPLENKAAFKSRMLDFEDAVEERRSELGLDVLRYALFQRAVFQALEKFIELGISFSVSPEKSFEGFLTLFDWIFENNASVFNFDQPYMQYTAFLQRSIRTREDTKRSFSDVILANLLREEVRGEISQLMCPDSTRLELDYSLRDEGFRAAGDLLGRYREERKSLFKKNFDMDYSLEKNERENLKLLEMEQKAAERQVKDGKKEEHTIEKKFDQKVSEYVEEYYVEAKVAFRKSLNIDGDLLEQDDETNDDLDDGAEGGED
jgi:hypothetical protein